ncbi:hypothetical protein IU459_31815 [Nocardia amamiensis]|uniref:Large ATP-binding protein n=1 Tax=Nocardia amamiensis TaxID=404578 RepID=A0ABS0CZR7_9NOCA|nr:hypothetical protein [Nocardia amamiensis]MBF6302097.1 hypothetical protein [Nocardia amamiensis]
MTSNMQVPTEQELHERIAERLGDSADPERVGEILTDHGLELTGPLPTKRELVVHRLYCDGEKSGTDSNDGPFTVDMRLGRGPWVIASKINSAGKSSLLWALSFALRGEGFDGFSRPETKGWFHYVRADVEVGGVAASIRLLFGQPGRPSVKLLTANAMEDLLALEGRDEDHPNVHMIASAGSSGVRTLIGRFMMERLGLQPMSVWTVEQGAPANTDGERDGAERVHGWASYFYAIALNSASDGILLGPTVIGQLPVKLMQLFLDVPFAPEFSRTSSLTRLATQEANRAVRRAGDDARSRHDMIVPLREALIESERRLRVAEAERPDMGELVDAAARAGEELAACQERHNEAIDQLAAARKARQRDQREERHAKQSGAARLLLGALDPEVCPRCDHAIDDTRRTAENADHRCSVCVNPLPEVTVDSQAAADAIAQIEARVEASLLVERRCAAAADTSTGSLAKARVRYEQASEKLHAARSGSWFARYEKCKQEFQQLQGAIAVVTGERGGAASTALVTAIDAVNAEQASMLDDAIDEKQVLTATTVVLKELVDANSRALFAELNDEIVRIARRLGVTNLTSVSFDLSGRLNAVKSGARHSFRKFSPVDRLRMRIATVVGMINIGRRRGIMSHPGLLLVDAPTADELTPEVKYQVLAALYDTAANVPGMQVIITSIEEPIWTIFPEDRILTGRHGRELF